jgi:hypothetical protein
MAFPFDYPSDCDQCTEAKDCRDKKNSEGNGIRVYLCKNVKRKR